MGGDVLFTSVPALSVGERQADSTGAPAIGRASLVRRQGPILPLPSAADPQSRASSCAVARPRSRQRLECGDSSPLSTLREATNVSSVPKVLTNPAPYTQFQSERDCVCQPRVARNELPWVGPVRSINPEGVEHRSEQILAATPLGLIPTGTFSQGCSFLATLGFGRNPCGIRAPSSAVRRYV